MSITLETILGHAIVNKNSLIYMLVERAKQPTITANLAKNVRTGYVVAGIPDNIDGFLMDTFAKDEYELVSVYDMEIREHNKREIQKIEEWEKNCDRLDAEAEKRYSKGVEEWQKRETKRGEEYDFESALKQEEAERASFNYVDLIFDALEIKGAQISAIRTRYHQKGYLNNLRQTFLSQLLPKHGIQDKDTIEDIVNLTNSKDPVLKQGLREILVEQLGVVFPEVELKEPLPPYEDKPKPAPEPNPDYGPKPKLELREITPLLPELESVVIAAYKGQDLESLNLTQQAWGDAGLAPNEIYNKVRGNVRPLNRQYLLVRAVAEGNKTQSPSIDLAILGDTGKGLRLSTPKGLRSYLIRPTELVEDAYALSLLLWPKIGSYLDEHEGDNEVFITQEVKEDAHLTRAIYKAILGRTTPLITNLFPELTQSSISEDKLSKYEDIALRVKEAFERGLMDAYDIEYKSQNFKVSANELVETIRYLVDLLPEELFELRYQTTIMNWAESTIKDMPTIDHERRMSLNARGIQYLEGVKAVGAIAKDRANSIILELGILREGRKDQWKLNTNLGLNAATTVLDRYGIGYTLEYTNPIRGR